MTAPVPETDAPLLGQSPSGFVGAPEMADVPILKTGSGPSVTRTWRKKQRNRKSQRIFAIAIPVVCFLLFFGVLGIVFFAIEPELAGALTGTNAGKFELPSATVSLADLGLTEQERAQTHDAFENDPEAFVSTQMTCRIRLDSSDLVTDITIGEGFALFVVNPAVNQHLSKWIRTKRMEINRQRLQQLAENGANLCRDKVAKAAGSQIVFDAQRYRDDFGLNAHVGAFGYVVEAITKQRRARCVHEDTNGTLYFVLPENTTQYTLSGRSIDGGAPLFPGEYSVSVAGRATPTVSATDVASENDIEKNTSDPEEPMEASEEMATPTESETDNSEPKSKKTE